MRIHHRCQITKLVAVTMLVPAIAFVIAGCGVSVAETHVGKGQIAAVGAENEYANVISQIGGKYVAVTAIESNPNIDPHSFEASPSVAEAVSSAKLVIQNGLGYDTYMNKIESASPNSSRKVIDVQALLGLPDSTPNPHLWYKPQTMPAVAAALVADLSALQPSHAAYFAANAGRFDASLAPWKAALAQFAKLYPDTPVATTEPVGDYMLQAAGTDNLTPFGLQADIMNGVDPAAQDVTHSGRSVLPASGQGVRLQPAGDRFADAVVPIDAKRYGIPVVGVYETMPAPGYDYQSWMLAEVAALRRAVAQHISTTRLG